MSAPGDLDRFFAAIPDDVVGVCRRLRVKGKRGWVVGGCVRDLLLGRPAKDWDIATDARPEEVMRMFRKVIPTGIKHGTVTVILDGQHYEVTTLRGEGDYRDGRRPDEVVFLEEIVDDLARRDFTINAIAIDPIDRQLVDPFHGQRDLAASVVRAVGDAAQRFAEDGLRILRAARFAATLGFAIEGGTLRAMGAERSLATLAKVSEERIHDEWMKTMDADKPSVAFEVMQQTGVIDLVCPELARTVGCPNPPLAGTVWEHSLATLDACPADRVLRIAALLHEIGKPPTREHGFEGYAQTGAQLAEGVLRRLKFSNHDRERAVRLVRHHDIAYRPDHGDAQVRRWIREVGAELVSDVITLAAAHARASGSAGERRVAELDELRARAQALLDETVLGPGDLAIRGQDLIDELGVPKGPRIGALLRELVEVVTEDPGANRRERLLAEARSRLAREEAGR